MLYLVYNYVPDAKAIECGLEYGYEVTVVPTGDYNYIPDEILEYHDSLLFNFYKFYAQTFMKIMETLNNVETKK
jgi:hypothetical protein